MEDVEGIVVGRLMLMLPDGVVWLAGGVMAFGMTVEED